MRSDSRVLVAGHTGLVGSAVVRRLRAGGFTELLLADERTVDLTDREATRDFFSEHAPEYVFLAAARVGGIHANDSFPADFIRVNLEIQTNVIDAAHRSGVKKLLFLGSSCIYPRDAPQPMREEYLLTGPLEPTNEAYAIAKIAGILMCKSYNRQFGTNFIAAMPTNLYGPGDNFDLREGHVLPAMIRKFHEARESGGEVELWGSGSPRREFLHVDDLADALLFLMERFDAGEGPLFLNVGAGRDIRVRELADLVARVVGFSGPVRWNPEMPDGTPRKLLDVRRIRELGWSPRIGLEEGILRTYRWYREREDR